MHVSVYQYICAHICQYRLAGIDFASTTSMKYWLLASSCIEEEIKFI